ncbi:MAG: NIL domain-containing protein [Thermosynechococcaceae cyanobacterium MS004]|nr:NIL domain-containing protein [Thermosynechococcaceae cyanobacterium MS004]
MTLSSPSFASSPRDSADRIDGIPPSTAGQGSQRTRQHIQIQIPPKYTQEPVISTLTTRFELEVNILSALLATNTQESGWFDLELYGTPERIQSAIAYLAELHIEILSDNATTQESWSFQ